MIITNSDSIQEFNCIFRNGSTNYSNVTIELQKEGYDTVDTYTSGSIVYKANYAEITYELTEEKPFVDGEMYFLTVKSGATLLYRDKIMVWDKYTGTNTQFNVYTSDYTFVEEEEVDDYVIIEEGASSGGGAGNTSETDTSSDDTDNDGYGNVTRLGSSTPIINSFNIMGEFTVDESQFGTFTTADAYTSYNVLNLDANQPSNVGTQPFYSQNGLADGFDGYVRYREGYDKIIAHKTYYFDAMNYPVSDGGIVSDYMVSDNEMLVSNWADVIYLDSTKTDITVGDSIYADDMGTPLADGTTNGKKNRQWFLWTDGDVVKVTAGVVTHKYNYKDTQDEKWIEYIDSSVMRKKDEDDYELPTKGKEWDGDEATGSLVTLETIDNAASELQTQLNLGFSVVRISPDSSYRYTYLNGTQTTPHGIGEYVYQRINGFNAGRRLSSDLEVMTQSTTLTNPFDGTVIDLSYKSGETYFKYLPIFTAMSSNEFVDEYKGAIVIEHNKYTGAIVDYRIVYKNNN